MKTLASVLCGVFIAMTIPASFNQSVVPPAAPPVMPPDTPLTLIQEDAAQGLELWDTLLGRLWIPKPGIYVIKHLQWEQAIQKVYDHPQVHVRPGDVVIDCGAHIGGFTRVALRAGARLVVAIEPEQANLVAFRRNLEAELKAGKVKLIEMGVWDKTGRLALHVSKTGDSHSVVLPQNGQRDESIEVTTIDDLANHLKLTRVDYIKMDIEGAERNALRGAHHVLRRFKPRLAISSYHLKGDPGAIATLVWESRVDYLVDSKDFVEGPEGSTVPKVLFFH
jgi:FkbM family methyltransferase